MQHRPSYGLEKSHKMTSEEKVAELKELLAKYSTTQTAITKLLEDSLADIAKEVEKVILEIGVIMEREKMKPKRYPENKPSTSGSYWTFNPAEGEWCVAYYQSSSESWLDDIDTVMPTPVSFVSWFIDHPLEK